MDVSYAHEKGATMRQKLPMLAALVLISAMLVVNVGTLGAATELLGLSPTFEPDLTATAESDPGPYPYPYPPYPGPFPTQSPQPATPVWLPVPTPAPKSSRHPAFVTVTQRPLPNASARRGGIVTYTIVATNRGRGDAENVTISMPFDPSEVRVLDAQFSRAGAWVSKLENNRLELQTGPVGAGGDAITATVRFVALAAIADGTSLAEQLTFSWSDEEQGGSGVSNRTLLVVAAGDADQAIYPLAVAIGGTARYSFSGAVFAPGEPVSFWYNMPTGRAVEVGMIAADANGSASVDLESGGLASGAYSMVAHGNWTGFTAVAAFQISP
jgi:hypothetical protein